MQEKPKQGHHQTPPTDEYDPPPQHQPPPQYQQQPAINVNVQSQNIQQQSVDVGGSSGGRIQTRLTMMQVLGHLIIWIIISVVTFGIGILFWPYAAAKLILNSIVIENRVVRCDIGMGEQIGHIILWGILIYVTLGLAFPFYAYGVMRTAINASRIA